ncbi:MAG: hypothetical protein U9R15_20430 [Chloroflexota bacterium]|nr:hypothetical protein [Chloroflexota bacterium]
MTIDLDSLKESTAIDVIVSSKIYTKIIHETKERVLCVIYPYGDDKLYSDFLYDSYYDNAIKDGILPREDLESIIKARGLITEKEKLREQELVKLIKGQEVLFTKMRFAKNKKDKVGENVKKLKIELFGLKQKFNSFYTLTAESVATEAKLNYLCWAASYNMSGKSRMWETYEDFDLEKDIKFRSDVINEVMSVLIGFSEETLRKIARYVEWRIRYTSSIKVSLPLFSRKPEDYTKDQLALVYWSNFYQNIYEMMPDDRPDDEVIENDTMLDAYMEEYYKGIEQNRTISRAKGRGSNAFDSDEVIVTRFSELYEQLDYDDPRESARNNKDTDLDIRRNKKR